MLKSGQPDAVAEGLQRLLCVMEGVRSAIEFQHGYASSTVEPHSRARLPYVLERDLGAKETVPAILMPDELQGKDATVAEVANLGDNPFTVRFQGVYGTFIEFTVMPRERKPITWAFHSIELRGDPATGATRVRVIAQ